MTLSPAFAGGRRGRGPLHARACNLILMRSGICPWRFWLRTCHFVPIDFYEVGDVPKFGEMTFYPGDRIGRFRSTGMGPQAWKVLAKRNLSRRRATQTRTSRYVVFWQAAWRQPKPAGRMGQEKSITWLRRSPSRKLSYPRPQRRTSSPEGLWLYPGRLFICGQRGIDVSRAR
jgi:hypothetical protein